MTVFIVQEPTRQVAGVPRPSMDLSPAQEFGELEFMLPPGPVMFNPVPMKARLKASLSKFSDDDYLMCIGDPTAMVWAGIYAAQANHNNVKMLKWNRSTRKYVIV
ncbi:MAG: hypothetical protein COA47_09990 [Robiginitomaculum sp.]|nr:MAG: hypothetical protein COA47_09990 [Robiginitomaculum sp.]